MLLSLAGLLVGACGGGEPTGPDLPAEPASLTLSADTVRLTAIGAGSRLTATVADANGIVLGEVPVSWSSADASVATVDGSGRVEAAAVGETQVTASAGDVSDAATVIVEQTAASVSVSPALAALYAIGDSVRYTATVRDANGHAIQGAAVAWTSADDAVATVDAAGWVTARANGSATITAAVGELSDEAAVVVEQRVASVGVTPSADTLSQHDVIELAATVRDANGVLITGAPVAWTTSAPTVATVDGGGKVTATGWGADAAIIATSGGVTGGAKVHVRDQIAFAGQPNGGGSLSIFVVNDDGSGAHLPSGVASDADPAWSPDGTKIAFSTNRDGDTEIYVMNADGTGQNRLTNSASLDFQPTWSPDGTKIAFTSTRAGNLEIHVMNADGSSPTNLTNDGSVDTLPAWSPEGSRIAFRTTRGGNDDIYVMNADGSNPTRLTDLVGSEVRPAWRPRP